MGELDCKASGLTLRLLDDWVDDGCGDADFDEELRTGHVRFKARACRCVAGWNPGVPHLVHQGEVIVDITQVDRHRQEVLSVAPGIDKEVVDTPER